MSDEKPLVSPRVRRVRVPEVVEVTRVRLADWDKHATRRGDEVYVSAHTPGHVRLEIAEQPVANATRPPSR